jgi:hypothetical protein
MSARWSVGLVPLALLVGGALLAVAGARHPLASGDGPAQLTTISATAGWRAIHLALLLGQVLVVAGVIGVALRHAESAGAAAARGGALLFTFGVGVALIQILFMGGAAAALAAAYARGEPGLTATQAAFMFDMFHPLAQLAGRAGEFAIGLGAATLGWGVVRGRRLPRGLGVAGVAAGAACSLWAVVTPEDAPLLMAGVGVVTAWAAACGVALLLPSRA